MGAVKTFVLDTNVLLHNSGAIGVFQDNDVVIPMAVVEELDKFKKNSDELGRHARMVIRKLDRLREIAGKPGSLRQGVPLQPVFPAASGKLYVLTSQAPDDERISREVNSLFGGELTLSAPDNRILRIAYELSREPGKRVIFISKDINLRLKADALGLKVMDFEGGKVDSDRLYSGFSELKVSAGQIERIYQEHRLVIPDCRLLRNEFALLTAEGNAKKSALARHFGDGELKLMEDHRSEWVWNISPRNKEQRMALELLLDPEIRLVTLLGGAGTGKTLLALAAGLQTTLKDDLYERILVSRPIIPLGNDIGFLPGGKEAKLASWMQPIFDNLDFLCGGDCERKPKSSVHYSPESLQNSRKLDLEALTYIRGRNIARHFVIVDEAQNLTPHEVKTIVSRCGEGTKMVLTGDPMQIDNPYLDASSNGLSYAVERMKGQGLFGHVTLARSERSELAGLAAHLL